MMKLIEVIVLPDGQTRVTTKGFSGSECRAASQFVEHALGQKLEEQLTPEFYATNAEQQELREGQ